MRHDKIYVHPRDHAKAFEFFRYCFDIWSPGYQLWGDERFETSFVKDETIARNKMLYCPDGEKDDSVSIVIGVLPELISSY